MPEATSPRVRHYLDTLNRALRVLPRHRRHEIVRDIRGHIDSALATSATPSEARIESVLADLGTPAEIAEAALAEIPERSNQIAGRDLAAIILLLVGGVVLPLIGWLIGVVLLWTSNAWQTKDKAIATLLVPGGLCAPAVLAPAFLAAGLTVSRSDVSAGGLLLVGLAITATGGPLFTTYWLVRHAHRTG